MRDAAQTYPCGMRSCFIGCLVLTLCGCEDAVEPGELEVTWRTAGLSCADGAITSVRAQLYEYERVEPVADETVECGAGALRLTELVPGGYSLVLQGFQGECLTHDARREDIDIHAGEVASVTNLPLDRRTRSLEVAWPFEGGGTCADYGIQQVQISVAVRGTERRRVPSLCQPGRMVIPDVEPGGLNLTLLAYDANGTAVMRGQAAFVESAFDASCGAQVSVDVQLSLCEGPSC